MTARFCLADCCKTPNVPMPADDSRTACSGCWARLEQQLAEMPALVAELDVTITRQAATGLRNGPRGNEKPLPYDVKASEALNVLHGALWGWVREGLQIHPEMYFTGSPDTVGLSRYLLRLTDWLQHHEDGQLAVEEINDAVRNAYRAIDRAADMQALGMCGNDVDGIVCEEHLRTAVTAKTVRCRTCSAEYDVAERRAWLLDVARDRLVTTREACAAVSVWGEGNITAKMIEGWKRRERIFPRSTGPDMWLLGDVIDQATKGRA
jgi:hypothetical protein